MTEQDPNELEEMEETVGPQVDEDPYSPANLPATVRAMAGGLDQVAADVSDLRDKVEDLEPGDVPPPEIEDLAGEFAPGDMSEIEEDDFDLDLGEGLAGADLPDAGQAIVLDPEDPPIGPPAGAAPELPEDTAVLQITGEEDGGGKYGGVVLYGGNASDPAADLDMPEGLTEDSENTVLIINMAEDGSDSHALAVDGTVFAIGQFGGVTDEETPRRIYYVEITAAGGEIRWAKATANWHAGAGDGSHVPANIYPRQDCAGDAEATGVDVYLPRNGSVEDPNVIENQVLACVYDTLQAKWIALDSGKYLDGIIGVSVIELKASPAGDNLDGTNDSARPGWAIDSDFEGMFTVGTSTTDGDYDAGDTGGFKWHGLSENNHPDHNLSHTHTVYVCAPGTEENDYPTGSFNHYTLDATWAAAAAAKQHTGPYNSNQDTDNRPPFRAVAKLVRIDNSAA